MEWTPEEVLDSFIENVKKVSVPGFKAADGYKVVYTPLNGTGIECVTRILKEIGVTDVSIVPEQAEPDGHFPTCQYPNPEFREALELALKLAEEVKPNLVVATDPDADRMGTAIPHDGDYVLISGNEMGVLLMDWLAQQAEKNGEDVKSKVAVTTIVSSTMPDALAKDWGFEVRRVLTGFKFIGDQIDQLKDAGEEDRYLMGFEESYGYLVGTHARDKDAIVATMLCVEMASDYAARGMDLYEAMEELYKKYGYYLNGTVNASFPGASGAEKMAGIMQGLRENPPTEIAGYKVVGMTDYAQGVEMPRVGGLQKEAAQVLPAGQRHRVPPRGRQQGHLPSVRHRAQGQGLPLLEGRHARRVRGRPRQAPEAASFEELVTLAKNEGIELSDEQLEALSGGSGGTTSKIQPRHARNAAERPPGAAVIQLPSYARTAATSSTSSKATITTFSTSTVSLAELVMRTPRAPGH